MYPVGSIQWVVSSGLYPVGSTQWVDQLLVGRLQSILKMDLCYPKAKLDAVRLYADKTSAARE